MLTILLWLQYQIFPCVYTSPELFHKLAWSIAGHPLEYANSRHTIVFSEGQIWGVCYEVKFNIFSIITNGMLDLDNPFHAGPSEGRAGRDTVGTG